MAPDSMFRIVTAIIERNMDDHVAADSQTMRGWVNQYPDLFEFPHLAELLQATLIAEITVRETIFHIGRTQMDKSFTSKEKKAQIAKLTERLEQERATRNEHWDRYETMRRLCAYDAMNLVVDKA